MHSKLVRARRLLPYWEEQPLAAMMTDTLHKRTVIRHYRYIVFARNQVEPA